VQPPVLHASSSSPPRALATDTPSILATIQQQSICGTASGLASVQYTPPPPSDGNAVPLSIDLGPGLGKAAVLSWPYSQTLDPVCLTRPINTGDVLSSSASGLISDAASSTRQVCRGGEVV
jgi:hypothetical protein